MPGGVLILVCLAAAAGLPLRFRFDSSREDFDRMAVAITSAPSGTEFGDLPTSAGSFSILGTETYPMWTIDTPLEKRVRPDRVIFVTGSGPAGFCSTGFMYVTPSGEGVGFFGAAGQDLGGGWRTWQLCQM
jgi:hypothetical protein